MYDDGVDGSADHLDYDHLEALVDQRANDVDREIAESHLAVCATCALALSDLEKFRHDLGGMSAAGDATSASTEAAGSDTGAAAPALTKAAVWRRQRVWIAAAAALVVAVIVPRLTRPPAPDPAPSALAPFEGTPSPPVPPSPPAAVPAVPAEPSGPAAPAGRTMSDPERLRSGSRRVGDKVFRLVAGEWVDTTYDRLALLPEVRVTGAPARAELLTRVPALRAYAALGDRVTVVHDGTLYRFTAP